MKRHKLIAAMMAGIMALGAAGCGSNDSGSTTTSGSGEGTSGSVQTTGQEASGTEAKDPITLTYWFCNGVGEQQDTGLVEEALNEQLKSIEGLEHVSIDLHPCGYDYASDLALGQVSGDPIDIVATYRLNFSNEVTNGSFIGLNDLLDEHPDIRAELPDWLMTMGEVDGMAYMVPSYQQAANMIYFLTPTEYLEKYGDAEKMESVFLDPSSTVQDKTDVIKEYVLAVRAGEGDTKYSQAPTTTYAKRMYSLFDEISGQGYFRFQENGTEMTYYPLTEEFRESVRIAAEWYEEGLIHPDMSTITINDYTGKNFMNDTAIIWNVGQGVGDVASTYSANYGFDVSAIPMFDHYYIGSVWSAGGNAISSTCDYPEEAMAVIELLCTEKGTEFYNTLVYGVEGKHYEKIDDTHIRTLEFDGTQGGADTSYCCMKWIVGNTFNAWLNQGCVDGTNEIILEIHNSDRTFTSPLMGLVFDTASVSNELSQCQSVADEYVDTLCFGILGQNWESHYNEMVTKLEAAGVQKALDHFNAQIDEFLASK